MNRASAAKASTPQRQPKPAESDWPSGVAIMAPNEPAADTMPNTRLREAGGTTRVATDMVSAEPVHAKAAPTITPAPSTTASRPLALASSNSAAAYSAAPTSSSGR